MTMKLSSLTTDPRTALRNCSRLCTPRAAACSGMKKIPASAPPVTEASPPPEVRSSHFSMMTMSFVPASWPRCTLATSPIRNWILSGECASSTSAPTPDRPSLRVPTIGAISPIACADRDLFIALAEGGYAGGIAIDAVIDVNEGFNSLSRSVCVRGGSDADLHVIDKHRAYLSLPEHHEFLNDYLLVVYAGSLEAGDRRGALRIVGELRRRGALDSRIFRYYLRHSPETRALKTMLRYDSLRCIRNTLKSRSRNAAVSSTVAENGANL